MKLRVPVLVVAAAFTGMAVLPLQASAHDTSQALYDTAGRVGYGGVNQDHQRLYSCDTVGDGIGFRAYYRLKQGQTGYVDDANGSKSGCSAIFPAWGSNPIVQFRVAWKTSGEYSYSEWKTA